MHWGHTNAWWRWDDPTHVWFILQYTPQQYLFDPEVWRKISPANFTPLLSISFDLDHFLFGLSPPYFYLRHVVSLCLAASMTYLLLRLWVSVIWAFAGTFMFLIGVPVVHVSEQLMTRHYVEGLLFFILALYLFVQSTRLENRKWLASIGGVAYFLAMMAKEVYIPLIFILPFFVKPRSPRSVVVILPYALALIAILTWRNAMLPSVTGGYATVDELNVLEMLRQFSSIPYLLADDPVLGAILFVFILGVAVLFFFATLKARSTPPPVSFMENRPEKPKRIHAIALAIYFWPLATALIIAPLIPLTIWPGIHVADRYLFFPWWTLSLVLAFWFSRIDAQHRKLALPLFLIFLFLLGYISLDTRAKLNDSIVEKETQARFIMAHGPETTMWLSSEMAANFWDVLALDRVKQYQDPEAGIPTTIFDESQIETHGSGTIWKFDHSCRCMTDISQDIADMRADWRRRLVVRSLDVKVRYENQMLSWQFGPFTDGQYFVIGDQIGKVPLPPSGQLRSAISTGLDNLLVRYDDPEGWTVYSKRLRVTKDGFLEEDIDLQ